MINSNQFLHKYLFLAILFLSLTQCQSNNSTKAIEDAPMHWQENGEDIIPLKVEGSMIQFPNFCQIVLVGRGTKNEGLLLLVISKTPEIINTHSLSHNRNKMGIPYEKISVKQNVLFNDMLEVYISEACRPASGKIVITDFDPKEHIISGYFEAKICTTGKLGRLDEKQIQKGRFNQVKLSYIDKR